MKKIRPFFSYFGSKYRSAPQYPIPEYETIIEPFAGAAGYSMRYYNRQIILNELSPVMYGIWDYLIHVSEKEIMKLPILPHDKTIDDYPELPQEAKWLIGHNLNKAAAIPCKRMSKWGRQSPRDTSFWNEGKRNLVAYQLQYIRHWKVFLGSYEDLEEKLKDKKIMTNEITWYIDPPYMVKGNRYKFSKIDFNHLGDWCQNLKGQVMVCENEGADWLPFKDFISIHGTQGKGRTGVSKEVIWKKND